MTDRLDQTARQVRNLNPARPTVHQLLAAVPAKDGGGRAYRTECHRLLSTQKAALTTAEVDCAECRGAASTETGGAR